MHKFLPLEAMLSLFISNPDCFFLAFVGPAQIKGMKLIYHECPRSSIFFKGSCRIIPATRTDLVIRLYLGKYCLGGNFALKLFSYSFWRISLCNPLLNYSVTTVKLIAMACKPIYDVLTIRVEPLNSQDSLVDRGLHSSL